MSKKKPTIWVYIWACWPCGGKAVTFEAISLKLDKMPCAICGKKMIYSSMVIRLNCGQPVLVSEN